MVRMVATRDFATYMVEVYANGDQPDHFFVTAWDG
jgi:hypothetical protein